MAFTTEQIDELTSDVMSKLSASHTAIPGIKDDLRNLIMWTDQFQDSIKVDYVQGIPAAFNGAGADLLNNIFSFVADKKWKVS